MVENVAAQNELESGGSDEKKGEEELGVGMHRRGNGNQHEDTDASNKSGKRRRRVSFLWSAKESNKAKDSESQRSLAEKRPKGKDQNKKANVAASGGAAVGALATGTAALVAVESDRPKVSSAHTEGETATPDVDPVPKVFFRRIRARKNEILADKEQAGEEFGNGGDKDGDDDSSGGGNDGKSDDGERRRERCPISKGLLSNFVSSRCVDVFIVVPWVYL